MFRGIPISRQNPGVGVVDLGIEPVGFHPLQRIRSSENVGGDARGVMVCNKLDFK